MSEAMQAVFRFGSHSAWTGDMYSSGGLVSPNVPKSTSNTLDLTGLYQYSGPSYFPDGFTITGAELSMELFYTGNQALETSRRPSSVRMFVSGAVEGTDLVKAVTVNGTNWAPVTYGSPTVNWALTGNRLISNLGTRLVYSTPVGWNPDPVSSFKIRYPTLTFYITHSVSRLKMGTDAPTKMYAGSSVMKRAFLGDDLVWI